MPEADLLGANPGNDAPVNLVINRFVLRPQGRSRLRLMAKASFLPTTQVEPDRTGMTVEVDGGDGNVLFRASVPAEMFASNYARTRFLYAAEGPTPAAYAGLKLLTVTTGRRGVVVIAKATMPASVLSSPALVSGPVSAAKSADAALAWTLHVGGQCWTRSVICSNRNKCAPM